MTEEQGKCDRCKAETNTTTMSMFNRQMICMDCKTKEKRHGQYQVAVMREREEVSNGNMNFEGIGLPDDLS